MKNDPIVSILKQSRFVDLDDPLSKVVSVLQGAQMPALPVVQNGRVAGMIGEASVLAYLSSHPDADEATVADAMDRDPVCGNIYMSVEQVADMMSSAGVDAMPFIDEFGGYRGVVTRTDVLAAMLDVIRPPQIAGMATPLGVHLTTGSISAGAGNLGLYLSGVAMVLMFIAAAAVIRLTAFGIDHVFGTHLAYLLISPPTGTMTGAMGIDAVNHLGMLLQLALMFLFLRLSPIAAYHAAEHQVVHAIEAGEPLTPESVARMPRAHPRCGTNLMVASFVFVAVATGLGGVIGIEKSVVLAIIVVIIGWRRIGYYLQQYFTTKPAGQKQLQNGIKVGEELLAKYRKEPNKPVDTLSRLWNMGMPQVALGFITGMTIISWLANNYNIHLW